MKKWILLLIVFHSYVGVAQIYQMQNTTINVCSGDFESSTGFSPTGPGYTNNENITMTFCPLVMGNVISVDFTSFVMGTGDVLSVYDGPNASSPLINVFDASNPAFGIVSASSAVNPGGCLTFVFVSDSTNEGNGWIGSISCAIPCQDFEIGLVNITPDTSIGGYLDVCFMDTARIEITGIFNNNNLNYNQTNSNVIFEWRFDTTIIDSGTVLNYLCDSIRGGYLRVFATDSLGCEADFNLNYLLRVATEPSFTGSVSGPDSVCFGENVSMNFSAISREWTNQNNWRTANETAFALIDVQSGTSSTINHNTINVTNFPSGTTLTNVSLLNEVKVNMSHTFLGDLDIKLVCPNGSFTQLKGFPNGGGIDLGYPCLYPFSANVPIPSPTPATLIAACMDYSWKPAGNTYSNMLGCGCAGLSAFCPGDNLPSGSYNSFTTMSSLVGCPLNGVWDLVIIDSYPADDGHLLLFELIFDSSLFTTAASQIITYDPGIDSIWIDSAAFGTTIYSSGDSLVVLPQLDSTEYCYTINVLDGFGCLHDTTMCFFVRDMCDPQCYNPQTPNWTVHQVSCPGNNDGSLVIMPDTLEIPAPWTFIWTDNSGAVLQTSVGLTVPDSLGGLVIGMYHVQIIDGNGCTSNWSQNMPVSPPINISVSMITATSCNGGSCDGSALASVFSGIAPYSYLWSSGEVGISANSLCAGNNMLTVIDSAGCIDSAIFVTGEPDSIVASATGAILICVGNSTNISSSATGGTSPYNFTWSNGDSVSTTTVSPTVDHTYTVTISDVNNCTPDQASVTVNVRPALNITFDSPDTLCIGDTVSLLMFPHGGDSIYSYVWEQGLGNTASVSVIVSKSQFYSVTLTDACGSNMAVDSVWLQVGGFAPLQLTTTPDDTICLGDQFYMYAEAFGGDNKFHYSWDNGLPPQQSQIVVPTQSAAYSVTVQDECLTPIGVSTITVVVGDFEAFSSWVDTTKRCDPAIFTFGFDTLNPLFTYSMNFGDGMELVDPFQKIERVFTEDGCHDIKVKLVNQYGCESVKAYPCLFKVLPTPIAKFDFFSHNPDVIEHYVDFWDESIGAKTWDWSTNGIQLSTKEKFSAPFLEEGVYNIKLVVSNEYNCIDSTDTDLPVANVTTYYFPTAFTPDGNGDNEVFRIVGEEVLQEGFSLEIFDRWGGLVFKTTSRDQGWNGKYRNTGDDMMNGTYMYKYGLKLYDGRKVNDIGNVILLR